MTDKINPSSDPRFKQVYVRQNIKTPFTSARIGLDDYLQTRVWNELRDIRLKIDGYKCVECGTGINVQVHHIHYPEVWGMESAEKDLRTFCDACHANVHINDKDKGDY